MTVKELLNQGEAHYNSYLDRFGDNQIVGYPQHGETCPIAQYIKEYTDAKDFYVYGRLVSVVGEGNIDLPAWAVHISRTTMKSDYKRLSKKNLLRLIA